MKAPAYVPLVITDPVIVPRTHSEIISTYGRTYNRAACPIYYLSQGLPDLPGGAAHPVPRPPNRFYITVI